MKKLSLIFLLLMGVHFVQAHNGHNRYHKHNNHNRNMHAGRLVLDLPYQGFFEVVVGNRVASGSHQMIFSNLRPGMHFVEIYRKVPYEGFHLVYQGEVFIPRGQRIVRAFRKGRLLGGYGCGSTAINNNGFQYQQGYYNCQSDWERWNWVEANYQYMDDDFYFHVMAGFDSDDYRMRTANYMKKHKRFNRGAHMKVQKTFKNPQGRNKYRKAYVH